jgi:hypothetical protein
MVTLALVCAIVGLVPGAVLALVASWWLLVFVIQALWLPFTEGGSAETVLQTAWFLELSLLGVGMPVLLLVGVVHLVRRRDRRLLIAACLPVTAFAGWQVYAQLAGTGGSGWVALVLLGPAVAPFLALAPSVGRWLVAAPQDGPARSSEQGTAPGPWNP